jgi:hypothetical protein
LSSRIFFGIANRRQETLPTTQQHYTRYHEPFQFQWGGGVLAMTSS